MKFGTARLKYDIAAYSKPIAVQNGSDGGAEPAFLLGLDHCCRRAAGISQQQVLPCFGLGLGLIAVGGLQIWLHRPFYWVWIAVGIALLDPWQ